MERAFVIGLGSNLGARERYLERGVEAISHLAVRLEALSRVYESAALGPPQPHYLNAAARLRTALDPEALLDQLLRIEAQLGRVRDVRWGPRVLDLDILWSAAPYSCARLTIPHAELRRRNFALAPLLDVAPELAPDYAPPLQERGGPPRVCGILRWDREQRSCDYTATMAL